MPLTKALLQECEDLIAANRQAVMLRQLLTVRDETGYKTDILSLQARWQQLATERINAVVSDEEQHRQERRFNRDSLRLLAAMDRELAGEKPNPGLTGTAPPLPGRDFGFTSLIGAIIGGALLAALGVYLFQYQPPADCSGQLNLSGTWQLTANIGTQAARLGTVHLQQEDCSALFLLTGEVQPGANEKDTDFSAQFGGLKNGEVTFIYENFDGERGVCRGIAPAPGGKRFTVHCIDLIGFDKDGQPKTTLVFSRE